MVELLLALIVVLLGVIGFFGRRQLSGIDAQLINVKKELRPITPAIMEIQGKLVDSGHSITFPLTISPGSPLKLTEYGDKLLKEFGFYEVFEKQKDVLVEKVKAMEPKTNYDIQTDSTEVIKNVLESDDPAFASLKEYAFNNGFPIEVIVPPAGIVLRDEVMEELKF